MRQITGAANEADTIEEAFRVALDRVCAFTGWPIGHAYVRSGGRFRSTGIWHAPSTEQFEEFKRTTEDPSFDIAEDIGAGVLATARPQWLADFTAQSKLARNAVAQRVGIQTALALPVLLHREVVAILEFFSVERKEPDSDLLRIMGSVGRQLSQVIERVEARGLLQEANDELKSWVGELERRNASSTCSTRWETSSRAAVPRRRRTASCGSSSHGGYGRRGSIATGSAVRAHRLIGASSRQP
jgi:GAF domain-containing protein